MVPSQVVSTQPPPRGGTITTYLKAQQMTTLSTFLPTLANQLFVITTKLCQQQANQTSTNDNNHNYQYIHLIHSLSQLFCCTLNSSNENNSGVTNLVNNARADAIQIFRDQQCFNIIVPLLSASTQQQSQPQANINDNQTLTAPAS
eukprot:UN01542